MKKVSVVIPCFNQGHYLAEAVESVIAQSRRPDQIIIINDGSTDNTAEVAAEFKGVEYFSQENRGLATARNTGLRHAAGDYILFLDADDILLPAAIQHCLAAFAAQPNVALVHGGFRVADCKGRSLFEALPQPVADPFAALLRRNYINMNGTVMYDVSILRQAGGFDETLRCCEDYDVYFRLVRNYPIGTYPHVAAIYRRHGANMSRNAPLMLRTALLVLARQAATARTSPDWCAAYAEGRLFWRRLYVSEVVEQWVTEWTGKRRLRKLASLVAAGFQCDPRFLFHLGRRMARASRIRSRRLQTL
jgi:glycosyltransferase involved in cell wall biosynthesis